MRERWAASSHKEGAIRVLTVIIAVAALGAVLAFAPRTSEALAPSTHQGLTAKQWHLRYAKEHRSLTRHGNMVRTLRQQVSEYGRQLWRLHNRSEYPGARYAIRLASSVFGVSYSEMMAVALCETGHTLNPFAKNRSSSASGLFQFLDSTWSSQGVAGFSVFDPVANALGAARIVARQGWRQWSCRP